MRSEQFLSLLEGVKPSTHGWTARCPAHNDRSPSLSVAEGERGILIKCWAGCKAAEIMMALGVSVQDLFHDAALTPQERRHFRQQTKTWRFNWRKTAAAFMGHAEALWLRGMAVLETARGLDCSTWTDADLAAAMNAVASAYTDLERSEILQDVAFGIRWKGLTRESVRRRAA
jgi:hypothetical protein